MTKKSKKMSILTIRGNKLKYKSMITGRKTALQYSTKNGRGSDRSSILSYTPDPRGRRRCEGKLIVTSAGYKYEPSGAYKRALNKFHTVPKSRVTVTNLSF